MACKECNKHKNPCPKRPKDREVERKVFENCAPFAGTSNTVGNVIFDVEPNTLRVLAAGTIENFSDAPINVIFERSTGNITQTINGRSSLTFVYDDLTRITVFGFGAPYSGTIKVQANYFFEDTI
ncbi:hypothetical protein V1498_18915 [Peribacillus sp. SCS-26]|uniref:hypothetical protein n=1 Tax=Paraperibacillus marinus TaxID=3115295 RepID=UPI00390639E9